MKREMCNVQLVLAVLLACCAAVSSQEKLRAVISVDLARFYSRLAVAPSKTALAVAYLLHEPSVQVLALAPGFGLTRTWYQQLLLKHPCKAAEMFLAELQRQDVPVVCGAASGSFLQRGTTDGTLERLMAGSGEESAAWVVLDSMAAAAAVTLPSLQSRLRIREFLFAGPGLRWFGDEPGAFGAPGLMLRSWQDSFNEAAPRLRMVRVAQNSTGTKLETEMKKCRGSWMVQYFQRAPFMEKIQTEMLAPMAYKLATSRSLVATSIVLGILKLVFPQDEDSLLLAAALLGSADSCAFVSLTDGEEGFQVSPELCRQERREEPPDKLYVKLQEADTSSISRVVDTLCDVAPPKVAEEL